MVAKLQVFCSEDLGAFYLDVLKDRLYTTAPKSAARRSAQTALWHITHAMLRWMAPFLSFTAEEAWKLVAPGKPASIFTETYSDTADWQDEELLWKWKRVRAVREIVNRQLEALRSEQKLGASLQAEVTLWSDGGSFDTLRSLGDDLRFVFITSKAEVRPFDSDEVERAGGTPGQVIGSHGTNDDNVFFGMLSVKAGASDATKCDRCWHYRDDVGTDAAHPTICGRCIGNLVPGAEEHRTVA